MDLKASKATGADEVMYRATVQAALGFLPAKMEFDIPNLLNQTVTKNAIRSAIVGRWLKLRRHNWCKSPCSECDMVYLFTAGQLDALYALLGERGRWGRDRVAAMLNAYEDGKATVEWAKVRNE
jgi:hypothetical protein